MYSTLEEAYIEMERLLAELRVEWEETRRISGRRENYWQGKKDGLRIGMNILHGFIVDGWQPPDIISNKEDVP